MIATGSLPYVRHRQRLDLAGLQREAARAAAGHKQAELADQLGVTPPAISQALGKVGAQYAALQRRIIAHLTDFRVEPVAPPAPSFLVERKN